MKRGGDVARAVGATTTTTGGQTGGRGAAAPRDRTDTVTDEAMSSHEAIAERLPDYVLGALPEDELGVVAAHLEGCARCRSELDDLLEMTSLLADAGPPRPEVRAALTARLAPYRAWPRTGAAVASTESAAPVPPAPIALPTRPREQSGRRRPSLGPQRLAPATAAALAVAAAMLIALGGWVALLQRDQGERERIAALVTGAGNAHPLTDTALASGAIGVIYTEPDSETALLLASGLPPLPDGEGYQVWFFTESGDQVAAGFFPVGADGTGQALVRAPRPVGDFWAVGLSAEPATGSPAPTGPLALGGWIR